MKELQGSRRLLSSQRPRLSRGHQPTQHPAQTRVPLFRSSRIAALVLIVPLLWFGEVNAKAAEPFGFPEVAEQAQRLATEPFKAPTAIPDFLSRLSYDDYRDIRFDANQSLWRDAGGAFEVQFIHPGLLYRHAVAINTIDRGVARPVAFSPSLFTYGRNAFGDKVPADLGFAGFRITYPLNRKDDRNHVLVFAGASYFRGVAKGEVFGLSMRGLAIDTALASGEEFPFFREFWLKRPARDESAMTVYALLDSQRMTGAYEFTVRPGTRTLVVVKAKLFERKRLKEIGLAPLTSMFLFGEERRMAGDWRPEVHDSDGLLIETGAGERIWRPLTNPERLRVSYFEVENPRGFGLLQRDRNFHGYEDLEARYDLRPSGWIAPVGNWGKGQIKLVEIPTTKETNDNIVAYWIPRSLPPAGQPIEFAYQIRFQSDDPVTGQAGRVTATRIGVGDAENTRRLVVDFDGVRLNTLPADAPVKAMISASDDTQIVQQSVFKNAVTGGWRLAFQVKTPKDKPLELRAFLQSDKDTLTETWTYQLSP